MISRRTFASRAALFVLGCALQVSGLASVLRRKAVTEIEQIRVGMLYHPNLKDSTETWIVADEGNYIIRNGVREEVGNRRENKWNVLRVYDGLIDPSEDPTLICFDQRPNLEPWNFHFPGI